MTLHCLIQAYALKVVEIRNTHKIDSSVKKVYGRLFVTFLEKQIFVPGPTQIFMPDSKVRTNESLHS